MAGLMQPSCQCHHVRHRAVSGGRAKSSSSVPAPAADPQKHATKNSEETSVPVLIRPPLRSTFPAVPQTAGKHPIFRIKASVRDALIANHRIIKISSRIGLHVS